MGPRDPTGGDTQRSETGATAAARERRLRRPARALVSAIGFFVPFTMMGGAAAQQVIINRIDDLPFGTWSGAGQMQQTMLHCVGSTTLGNGFNVRATGSGTGGAFTIASGVGSLAYTVEYRSPTAGSFQTLTAGITRSGFSGTTTLNCILFSTEPAAVRVTFSAANLAAARAGSYSGTLTLTVAPE